MTALPRKHPTGRQKLKKSNRVYPNYSLWERLRRKKKPAVKKPLFGPQGSSQQGQPLPAQPQRGWRAEQAQNQQPQQPVPNWWRILVMIIMAILAIMVLAAILGNIMPNPGPGPGSNPGGDCTCYCENGDVCTSNPQCPDSPPGVPGICGCPVGC